MTTRTGGCLCGKVRYEAKGDPLFQGVCHCTDCQKQAGTAFSVVAAWAESDLEVKGELKTFTGTGTSGNPVYRQFCPDCGSPIASKAPSSAGMVFVKAGTLDDTTWLAPAVHIWCDSKQAWVSIPEGVVAIPKAPN